jgi:hypothetical protein
MRTPMLGALLAALTLADVAQAQQCSAWLPDGVLDRAQVNNTLALVARAGTWFCNQHFAAYDETTAPARTTQFPVRQLLAPFGLTRDGRGFPAAYQTFCGAADTDRALKAGSLEPFVAVNKSLASGYITCLRRGGAGAYAEAAHDPRQFFLVIRWMPLGNDAAPKVEGIAAMQDDGTPITCSPALPGHGAALERGERRYLCSRDPRRAVHITATLSSGTTALPLAPFARYRLLRDEVRGDSEMALAGARGGDGLPVCVGAPSGGLGDGEYLIDYGKTTGVAVGIGPSASESNSWRLTTKERNRVCLTARGSAPPSSGGYRIHYVFYRYRLEKTRRFSLPPAVREHTAP